MDIHQAWKETCRTVLGGEVGELTDYKNYLSRFVRLPLKRSSVISSAPVFVSQEKPLGPSAPVIANDESAAYSNRLSSARLDLNQIKDIDSIRQALDEVFCYSGSVVLGDSQEVHDSDSCVDSIHILDSQEVFEKSKFIAYSEHVRNCDHCFGISLTAESRFLITGPENFASSRCFETLYCFESSGCAFCANLIGCHDCLFTFNQRNQTGLVGNLKLEKSKYNSLKQKLMAEVREELVKKKKITSIIDIINSPSKKTRSKPLGESLVHRPSVDIEKAFQETSRLVLGRSMSGLPAYGKWLGRRIRGVEEVGSAKSGQPVPVAGMPFFMAVKEHVMSDEEALEHGKMAKLAPAEVEELTLTNAPEKLAPISDTTVNIVFGKSEDIVGCACYGNYTSHAFITSFAYHCKNVAYCFYPRNSENLFGSFAINSKYCIHCRSSERIMRCFEVDNATDCADCLFCHNIEGCQDCMFCFNVKSKRYAIGNVEYPKEDYLKLKKLVLAEISAKLEKDKNLDIDIYNIGSGR